MKSSKHLLNLFIIVVILIENGCSVSYNTTKMSELQALEGQGPLRALTVDSLLYTFESFSFNDSLLIGLGTLKQKGITTPFNGRVPFERIVFIERLETSVWKGVWLIPMIAGVALGLVALTEPSSFEIDEGGSCPYIYAFDGTKFKLEAEAFGTSISRALEAQTFSLLPSLVPDEDLLKVRISNERPETHLLNNVQLLAADAQKDSSVILDIDNVLWPLPQAISPVAARDHSRRDILSDIIREDRRYWKSDLAHITAYSGFRDQLEVEFDLQPGTSSATLVIRAINTDLITEVYRSAGGIIGDETMQFYHALENDSQFQSIVRDWIQECGLRVEVADGAEYKQIGVMLPEATVAPFSRAIRINGLEGFQNQLHVRLSSLTDVWRIDAIAIDYSEVHPLPLRPLDMLSATSSMNVDLEDQIRSSDSSYALILPPHHLDMAFDPTPTLDMQTPVYVFVAKGFLYEWFPRSAGSSNSFVSDVMTGSDRAILKLLLQQKDLFLPPIYAAWQQKY